MVFEVDNTTRALVKELQDSIQDTIKTLKDGQDELKDLLGDVQRVCSESGDRQENVVSNAVDSLCMRLQKAATSDDVEDAARQVEAGYNNVLSVVQKLPDREFMQGQVNGTREALLSGLRLLPSQSDLEATAKQLGDAQCSLMTELKSLPGREQIQELFEQQSKAQAELFEALKRENKTLRMALQEASATREKAALERLDSQFKAVADHLTSASEAFGVGLDKTLTAQERSLRLLQAIGAYLALPGYRRFFKGMEIPSDDII